MSILQINTNFVGTVTPTVFKTKLVNAFWETGRGGKVANCTGVFAAGTIVTSISLAYPDPANSIAIYALNKGDLLNGVPPTVLKDSTLLYSALDSTSGIATGGLLLGQPLERDSFLYVYCANTTETTLKLVVNYLAVAEPSQN